MLWLILTLMTAAAIFAVLWPLSRRAGASFSGTEVAVYRDQLDEIERDRATGLIGPAEADAARVEVSRRLLAAADAREEASIAAPKGELRRRRAVALIALIALPAGAAGIYLAIGSPHLANQLVTARPAVPIERRSVESLVAQVESHLERNPEDGRGWDVIAPVYLRLGRFDDAVKARRNALRILGSTPLREADLGEALTAAAGGVVTADAKAAFDRAATGEPGDIRIDFYKGLAAEQDGKTSDAVRIWTELLARIPADAPYRELIAASLARLDPKPAPTGPTAEDMAAAKDMSPEQRTAMVRGMVERLAERLKNDGSDLDGWQRLVRAYMVLGEADNAKSAVTAARKALSGDQDKQRLFDEFAKAIGVEG
jgi:cytochrome c-type biogenesis protein CcmH